jgi:hypothetical protein
VRIAPSKGSTRLVVFLYLKTEAKPVSEFYYCIKIKKMDKDQRKKITSNIMVVKFSRDVSSILPTVVGL